jgi:hypothetical protein
MAYLMGSPFVQQFIDADGAPLINGTIEFYIWNTSTPTAVYSDSTGTSAGTSVTLNSLGSPMNGGGTPIALFFDTAVAYKIIRKTAAGAAVAPTIGPYYPGLSSDLWSAFTGTPTRTSATTFTLTGDQTATFQVGRRLKFTDSSTLYGTITVSAYTTLTTVTVVLDSGSLSASLTAVYTSVISVTNKEIAAPSIQFIPAGTGAVATNVQNQLRKKVYFSDFEPDATGVADSTTKWQEFIAQCVVKGAKGCIEAGTYLIDSFTFTSAHAGLRLEAETFGRTAGSFGLAQTVLKCRSAIAKFIQIDGAYDLNISGLSLNGNKLADNVLYYPGTNNNTNTHWEWAEFCGCTPTTGYIHRFDGGTGGEGLTFYKCVLSASHNRAGSDIAAACVYNSNTNTFLGEYDKCTFSEATYGMRFNQGAFNLNTPQFYSIVTDCIALDNTVQEMLITNPYVETGGGGTNPAFLTQYGTAGVTSDFPIIIMNPKLQTTGGGFNINCQQPIHIYGGFSGGNVAVYPMATYGTQQVIIDGLAFNSGYGITGPGAESQVIHRGVKINNVPQADNLLDIRVRTALRAPGLLSQGTVVTLANAGATPSVLNRSNILLSNSGAQNVTTFADSDGDGHMLQVYFADANTTLVHGATLKLQGSINVTPTAGSILMFQNISAAWYEVSRSIK